MVKKQESGQQESGQQESEQKSTWKPGDTVALVVLIAAIFVVGLIPSNQIIPGFNPPEHGLVAWLVIMVLLGACCVVIGRGTTGLWKGLLIDSRNRMSLSRLQLLLWTVLVLSAFLTIAMFNIRKDPMADPLNIEVPSQVWALLGISTSSFVTAATIKSQKKNMEVTSEAKHKSSVALEKMGKLE